MNRHLLDDEIANGWESAAPSVKTRKPSVLLVVAKCDSKSTALAWSRRIVLALNALPNQCHWNGTTLAIDYTNPGGRDQIDRNKDIVMSIVCNVLRAGYEWRSGL